MMVCIIDGYNLMHALEPGGITRENLPEKRERLVEAVVNYTASTGERAVVVFDSRSSKEVTSRQLAGTNVSIVFSSRGEIADIVIGRLVQEELKKGTERIRVVSADWEVQKGAMMDRVERVPPRHFIAHLKNFEKKVANSAKVDKMRWKIEHKVDVETLEKLERMRRGEEEE